jgi:hypothetical protein
VETTTTTQRGDRLAPIIIREVLERMGARGLQPTPENFAWTYRQVVRAKGLPTELQYTSEIVALQHALGAFEDLLIGNAWLAGRFRALAAVAEDATRTEDERTSHARVLLDEVASGKEQALQQAAKLVVETREAVAELLVQVRGLADQVASGRDTFARALRLAEDATDVDDFRRALDAIARDAKRLGRSVKSNGRTMVTSYKQFATTAPYLFGPPKEAGEIRPL